MQRSGLSLIEIAIVAVILAIMVLSYFTLSRQETVSTRYLQDRACAMALARNLLCLVRHGHNRAWLDDAGVPSEEGTFVFPAPSIPLARHAYGTALQRWSDAVSAEARIDWRPLATDVSGRVIPDVGQVTCTITWQRTGSPARTVVIPEVMRR